MTRVSTGRDAVQLLPIEGEALFFEVMHSAKEVELDAITGELNADADDLKRELMHFGQKSKAWTFYRSPYRFT